MGFFIQRRGSLAVVAVAFILVFTVFQASIVLAETTGRMGWLMDSTAKAAGLLIDAVGIPATVLGNRILLATSTLQIDIDCTGIAIAALYSALVIAYPLAARTRLLALAVGIPVIAIVNLLRLLGVAVAVEHLSPTAFGFVHDYLFKVAMMLVVVGLWAAWLQIARGHAKTI